MDELADLMIVSRVELVKGEGGTASAVEGLGVAADHAVGRQVRALLEVHRRHRSAIRLTRPLCARCASVIEG